MTFLRGLTASLCFFPIVAAQSAPAPGQLKWAFLKTYAAVSACPAVVNGVVYAPSTQSGFFALDAQTGELKWDSGDGEIYASPVVASDGRIYYGNYGGSFRGVSPETGMGEWGFYVGTCVHAIAAESSDGLLYFTGNKLYAVDPVTHAPHWEYEGGDSGPSIGADGTVYHFGFGGLYAIDSVTGRARWTNSSAANSSGRLSLAIGNDGTLYLGGLAMSGNTGETLWQFSDSTGDAAVGPDGTVYVSCHSTNVCALDGRTGELKWEFETGAQVLHAPAVAADGTVYVASHKLYALDAATGEKKWDYNPSGTVGPPNIGPDGTIYFGVANSEGGGVIALHGSSPLAASSWPKYHADSANRGAVLDRGTPRVTRDPISHWAALGSQTTFAFYSPTARPFAVQWRFNGTEIPGATSEVLRLSHVRLEDAGRYSANISNQSGSITSAEGLLSVGYSLHASVEGVGSIRIEPPMDVYPPGTVVELEAIPGGTRAFLRWDGDVTELDSILTLTMNRNYDLNAWVEYLNGDTKWQLEIGGYEFDPPVAIGRDATVYLGTEEGKICALEGGRHKRWEFATGRSISTAVVLGNTGSLYVAALSHVTNSLLFALDAATGRKLWQQNVPSQVFNAPALGLDETIYLTTRYAGVLAVDGTTGATRWTFSAEGELFGSPAIGPDSTVYAAGTSGKVHALRARDGTKLWDFQTDVTGFIASLTIGSNGLVLAGGSYNGKLYALNGRTGKLAWDFSTEGELRNSGVVDRNGMVYIGSLSGNFYALDGVTGRQRWVFPVDAQIRTAAVLGNDGTVYFTAAGYSGGATLHALDAATGTLKWDAYLGGNGYSWSSTATLDSNGTLYVGYPGDRTLDWRYYCYLLAIHVPSGLADGGWPKQHGPADNRGRAYSRPFLGRERFSGDGFEFSVFAETGEHVRIEKTTDLRSWDLLDTRLITNGPAKILDPLPSPQNTFYRVQE